MTLSNFQSVKEFNRAFDMVSKEPQEYIGYDENIHGYIKINPYKFFRSKVFVSHSLIRLRLNLIKEEIEELNDAIKVNDMKETRDAIGDILYVVYGMADIFGVDIDYIFSNTLHSEVFKYYLDTKINDTKNTDNINTVYIDKIISASSNGFKTITNFNYIKLFTNELSETKITIKIILDNINELYLNLEKECQNETIVFDGMNNYYNDSVITIDKKIVIVSQYIYNLLKNTYLLATIYNIDADSDFAIIHESNMSKLCDTEQDAKDTVVDYEMKYKNGKSPYDSPYYYELPELKKWIVKNKSSGKALKNIKYKEVTFS
jgi:predicted HAD superfamily Cof-like phosphohydrolase